MSFLLSIDKPPSPLFCFCEVYFQALSVVWLDGRLMGFRADRGQNSCKIWHAAEEDKTMHVDWTQLATIVAGFLCGSRACSALVNTAVTVGKLRADIRELRDSVQHPSKVGG